MNKEQLLCAIDSDPVLPRHVWSIIMQRNPNKVSINRHRRGWGCLVNTDVSNSRGQNWVAFYFKNHVCEFFDSFGHPPGYYSQGFGIIISKHFRTLKYNIHVLYRVFVDFIPCIICYRNVGQTYYSKVLRLLLHVMNFKMTGTYQTMSLFQILPDFKCPLHLINSQHRVLYFCHVLNE